MSRPTRSGGPVAPIDGPARVSPDAPEDRDAYIEAVLQAIESIPPGRVASYGDIAEFVGRGGPRQVGFVMSHYGSAVCWWRVVRADGRPPRGHEVEALTRLAQENAVLRVDRVDMQRCRWSGPDRPPRAGRSGGPLNF